jgi:hypothetical protein
MKIVPDDKMKELASKAMQVQDACNITAVAAFLAQALAELQRYELGSDWVAAHPITKCIVNKLNHLAGLAQDGTQCFIDCSDLSGGMSCEIPEEELGHRGC